MSDTKPRGYIRSVASDKIAIRCSGGAARCWFTVYGVVGVRAPVCQRYGCGRPNPRPLSKDELAEYEYVKRQRWEPSR